MGLATRLGTEPKYMHVPEGNWNKDTKCSVLSIELRYILREYEVQLK